MLEIPTFAVSRPEGFSSFHDALLYDRSGYEAFLGAYRIPAGVYDLGELVTSGSQMAVHWEGRPFIMPPIPASQ